MGVRQVSRSTCVATSPTELSLLLRASTVSIPRETKARAVRRFRCLQVGASTVSALLQLGGMQSILWSLRLLRRVGASWRQATLLTAR